MNVLKQKAIDYVTMLTKPSGDKHPTKKQVFDELKVLFHQDPSYLDSLVLEKFICKNGEVEIYGDYFPNGDSRICVILAHGFAQNRYVMLPQLKIFHELGYNALWFDQRAFGESKEASGTFGAEEAKDVASLVRWVKETLGSDMKIVLLGVSMGAATVMNALFYTDEIDLVIADCGFMELESGLREIYEELYEGEENPYLLESFLKVTTQAGHPDLKHSPLAAIIKSKIAICVIHGDADTTFSTGNAKTLFQASSHPDSHLELFPEKGHALSVTDTVRYSEIVSLSVSKI